MRHNVPVDVSVSKLSRGDKWPTY